MQHTPVSVALTAATGGCIGWHPWPSREDSGCHGQARYSRAPPCRLSNPLWRRFVWPWHPLFEPRLPGTTYVTALHATHPPDYRLTNLVGSDSSGWNLVCLPITIAIERANSRTIAVKSGLESAGVGGQSAQHTDPGFPSTEGAANEGGLRTPRDLRCGLAKRRREHQALRSVQ